MISSETNSLIELDAKPFEGFENILFRSRNIAMRIGILNTKDQFATMLTCKEVVVKSGTYTANV